MRNLIALVMIVAGIILALWPQCQIMVFGRGILTVEASLANVAEYWYMYLGATILLVGGFFVSEKEKPRGRLP